MFLDDIVAHCHSTLLQPTSKIPLAYLLSRGITLEEMKKYRIGYIHTFLPRIQSDHEEWEDFTKWSGPRGTYIGKRLVFPIHDELGNIKGIETRAVDRKSMSILKPEYKKSLKNLIEKLPDNEVRYKKFYLKKCKFTPIFYGLPYALESIWATRTAFMSEGIIDHLSLAKIMPNSISPLTANLSKYQIKWLRRYVENLFLLFDMDEKGKESVEKMKKFYGRDFNIHSIPLKGKDINQFLIDFGVKDLEFHIKKSTDRIF